jgi:aminopeptidase N
MTTTAADDVATTTPVEIQRTAYAPLPWSVTHVTLDFDIRPGQTVVQSVLTWHKNEACTDAQAPVILDGDETSVRLQAIALNDQPLVEGTDYVLRPGQLELLVPLTNGDALATTVHVVPEENTQLSGLYQSGSMYCTQCEAQGFRRITYFPDRPDNMATFTRVTLTASAADYPTLLSNGNLLEEGTVKDEPGRHYAVWSDPFPKPSYLFAAVVGNLASITDTYTTRPSGRVVDLAVFSEPANVHKLDYAMESLKKSMQWDEGTSVDRTAWCGMEGVRVVYKGVVSTPSLGDALCLVGIVLLWRECAVQSRTYSHFFLSPNPQTALVWNTIWAFTMS